MGKRLSGSGQRVKAEEIDDVIRQLYLVAEFVSYPKRGASSRKPDKSTPPKPTSALQAESSDSKHPAVQSVMNDVLSGSVSSSGVATPTTNGSQAAQSIVQS
jgi:hypothetical protein